MLNAATLAAIVAACWAHPQGVAYLAKIAQIEAAAIARGNPCCVRGGVAVTYAPRHVTPRPRQKRPIENDEALLLAGLI